MGPSVLSFKIEFCSHIVLDDGWSTRAGPESDDDPENTDDNSGSTIVSGLRVSPQGWRRWRRMTAVAAGFFLSACAGGPDPAEFEAKVSALEAFLQDGVTRRDEVLARLGIPHADFEDGRIIGYYLRNRDELIVVFDEHGILERHSFLKFPASQP